MGGVVKKIAKPVGSLLFGKKQGDIGPDAISGQIRETHEKALLRQKELLDDVKGIKGGAAVEAVKKGAARQTSLARGSAADQRRQLQESIARRGLGRSSLALSAGRDIQKDLGQRIGQIERGIPMAELQAKLGVMRGRGSIINPIAQATKFPVQMRAIKRGRKGGLAPVIGAGVGAMFGGAQGAGAGMQIGQGLKGAFS